MSLYSQGRFEQEKQRASEAEVVNRQTDLPEEPFWVTLFGRLDVIGHEETPYHLAWRASCSPSLTPAEASLVRQWAKDNLNGSGAEASEKTFGVVEVHDASERPVDQEDRSVAIPERTAGLPGDLQW